MLIARERLPRERGFYFHISVVGFFGIALPFVLITFAETTVDSSLAAVLTAPVPLFVIPFAALLLPDEGLTVNKVVGVLIGLVGVAVLVGFDPAQLGTSSFFSELVLIGAAISYAIAGVYARRFVVGQRPMISALFEVFTALIMVTVLAFLVEKPLATPMTTESWMSVIWLGLVGSGLAFLAFFRLLGALGRRAHLARRLPAARLGNHPRGGRARRGDPPGADHRADPDHRRHRPGQPQAWLDRPPRRATCAPDSDAVSQPRNRPSIRSLVPDSLEPAWVREPASASLPQEWLRRRLRPATR